MTLKIKYKSDFLLSMIDKGEWVDVRAKELIHPRQGAFLVPLSVAMQLPKGYEALLLPRSSTYKNFGIMSLNSMGVIDHSFRGDEDYWAFPALAPLEQSKKILQGDRIAQFRIQLSQKASIWQKLKWLFTSKIEFVKVDSFNEPQSRGGFGTTGTV